jgi:hypothetical protein
MRMRRNKVIGVAAAALVVTACGIVTSNSGGIPGGHPAPVSARHASAATPITDQEMFARVKRHLSWPAGDPVAQQSATPITDQEMFARVKRHLSWPAGDPGVQRPCTQAAGGPVIVHAPE